MFSILKKNQDSSKSDQTSSTQQASFDANELEILLSISDDILIIVNDLGEIIKCNAAFTHLTGYTETELKTMHFMDIFADQDKPYIRNTVQSFDTEIMGAKSPTFNFEGRIITKAGETRWMEWCQQLNNNRLFCSGRNITDIKTQKKELNRREKQLSQAENIGRMGHWSWLIGQDNMKWSHEIYRIFGVIESGFTPTLDSMNKVVDREDIKRVNQAFQRAVIEEKDYEMEFRIKRPDGETRYIRCEGRCSYDLEGEVTSLYGIMQDMTERILNEKNLREAKDQAEHAYAARTQFLANMSHELRTPLNAIIGFSEMVEQQLLGPIGNEKYLEYVSGIRESGEHLLDLISDILDMSKIEAGKYQLDLEELKVSKIIQLAAHMIEGRAHESHVRLIRENEFDENLKIIADRRAILQILLNLMSNAIKFTNEDGKVTLTTTARDDYLVIRIMDTGIGIPAHKVASVTKPFEQISSSYARNHEGSGLGLSITKDLIEMHGGHLYIESKLNIGTTVTVRLPYDAYTYNNQKNKNETKTKKKVSV